MTPARFRQSKSTHCNLTFNFSTTCHVYIWTPKPKLSHSAYQKPSNPSRVTAFPAGTGASRAEVQTYTASTRAQDLKNLSKCLWASDHFMSAIYTALQMAQDVNAWFWQYWDLCCAETSPKRKPHVPYAFPGTWQRAGNPQCHSTRHLFKS